MQPGIFLSRMVFTAVLGCAAIVLTSCAAYRVPTSAYGPKPGDPYFETRRRAVENPLYDYVPRKREQLHCLDPRWLTWCLLGNEEDGIFGEYAGAKPYSTNINFRVFLAWSVLRNPLHNFDRYTIGSAAWKRHYDFSVLSFGGAATARAMSNSAKWKKTDDPVFDFGFNDFKPYLKCNPWRIDFFLGWRRGGAFEIKCRVDSKKRKPRPPAFIVHNDCT